MSKIADARGPVPEASLGRETELRALMPAFRPVINNKRYVARCAQRCVRIGPWRREARLEVSERDLGSEAFVVIRIDYLILFV